jgi:hypothetical protein
VTRPRRRRAVAAAASLAATAALVVACTDVPSAPDEAFSIEFERLPFPAVVLGDTLRDSAGVVRPLSATAFNVDGTALPASGVAYAIVGRGATLLPGNLVRGDSLDADVRVSAIAGTLPSLPRALRVVPRPDSLAGPTTPPGPLLYGPLTALSDRSDAIAVRVLSAPTAATPVPVQQWVVRYRLLVRGDTVAPGDTSFVWLVDESNRRAPLDTTDATGTATRRVRINGLSPKVDGLDSVVVSVTVQGTRTPPRGAPIRIALPVRLRQ